MNSIVLSQSFLNLLLSAPSLSPCSNGFHQQAARQASGTQLKGSGALSGSGALRGWPVTGAGEAGGHEELRTQGNVRAGRLPSLWHRPAGVRFEFL